MLRCEICCLCAFVVALAASFKASQSCTSNQYKKILPSGRYSCVDCPRCPANYGLSIKCGTTIAYDARIKCQYCSLGANYSTENDYTQCLPCKVCAPDVTSTSCTRGSNTVCRDKCESKENYYEKRSRDCQKCSWCCHDGNDELQQDCLKNGMPRNQSCSVRQGRKCSPVNGKTTTQHVVSSSTTTTITTTDKPAGNTDNTPSSLLITYVVSCIVTIGILSIVVIIFVIAKRHRGQRCEDEEITESECDESSQTSRRNPEEQSPEASSQGKQVILECDESSQTSRRNPEEQPPEATSQGPNVRLFEWLAMNHDIRVEICSKLDDKLSYADVARYYKMKEHVIKWLIHKDKVNEDFSPTKKVLEILETGEEFDLLMSNFCQCLDKIGRCDVSAFLKSEFKKTITSDADQV